MVVGMTDIDTSGTPRNLIAAGLHTSAEAVRFGSIPLPHSIDIWCHDLSRRDLLTLADRHEADVEMRFRAGPEPRVIYPIVTLTEKHTGLFKTIVHLVGVDASEADVIEYQAHNASCIDRCADDL